MADKIPLKLVDLGSGQGTLKEFESGDTIPGALVPTKANAGTNNDITTLAGLTTPITPVQGGIGKGYIDGFKVIYTGRNSVTITAGTAYVPGLGRSIELPSDKVLTGLGLPTSAFVHVYAYNNAGVTDVELVSTVPVKYYGTAYTKTGDNTRRYVCSLLCNSSAQFFAFNHEPISGTMNYNEGQPSITPFAILTNYAPNGSPVLGNVDPFAPVQTSLRVKAMAFLSAGATLYASPADQATAVGTSNYNNAVTAISSFTSLAFEIDLSRSAATLGRFYFFTAGANVSLQGRSYQFER